MPIAALLAIAGPLLPVLIKGIENLFGKGAGNTKLDVVTQFLEALAGKLVTSGTLTAAPPTDHIIGAIEAIVQDLIAKGELNVPQGLGLPIPTAPPSTPVPAGAEGFGTITFTGGSLLGVRHFPITFAATPNPK